MGSGGEGGGRMGFNTEWEFREEFPEEVTFIPKQENKRGLEEQRGS